MFSDDDDKPLVAKSDLIGHDGNVPINVNGHVDSSGDQDSFMSEDDEDNMPLVCSLSTYETVYVFPWPYIKYVFLVTDSRRQI